VYVVSKWLRLVDLCLVQTRCGLEKVCMSRIWALQRPAAASAGGPGALPMESTFPEAAAREMCVSYTVVLRHYQLRAPWSLTFFGGGSKSSQGEEVPKLQRHQPLYQQSHPWREQAKNFQ
jgi:hypothetical protein